jgi:hypothetical protein
MIATVHEKYDTLAPMMDEQLRRRWAGCEAMALGRGGITAISAATGLSRNTIARGIQEVQEAMPELAARARPQTSVISKSLIRFARKNTRNAAIFVYDGSC